MNPFPDNLKPVQNGFKLVVLVSGRGSNFQAILDAQKTHRIKSRISAVISNKPEAQALERARRENIPVHVVPSKGVAPADFNSNLLHLLQDLHPDLIVLAGFMKILAPEIIKAFEGRIINIHPSLLPQFPGLDAQKQAVDARVKVTGCTVHFVDEGCDTGPVILQNSIPVLENDSPETLSARLLPVEHDTLIHAIVLLEKGEVVLQGHQTLLRS